MASELKELMLREVSLVDRPANSSIKNGKKTPHAIVALWKRDGSPDFDAVLKAAKGIKFVIGFPKGGGASKVQSVIFDQDQWKESAAKKWLTDNDFVSSKVETTENSLRFRQEDPEEYANFRTIEPGQTTKGEAEMALTLQQIEEKVVKQDGLIAQQATDITALKAEREALVRENEAVLKMSKSDRKGYAAMDVEKRKAFMAADDTKKKQMLDEMCANKREEDLVEAMEPAMKAQFAKAGPVEKAALLEVTEKRVVAKAAKEKPAPAAGEGDGEAEPDEDDMEKAAKVAKAEEATLVAKQEKAVIEDRLRKAEVELTDIRKRERLVTFAKRAEDELPHTAGSPSEKGEMLMKMADTFGENSDVYKSYLGQLKAADAAMASHFREIGKSGGTIHGEQALQAKAAEIAKRDSITVEKAYIQMASECPQLFNEYEIERRHSASRQ